jgi:hypothetical protein
LLNSSLDSLIDVTITTPVQNNILRYDSASQQWKNDEHFAELVTYVVTVVEDGSGIQEVFALDGHLLKTNTGTLISPTLRFKQGYRYRFDLSDTSNAPAPLRFSRTPDTIVDPASLVTQTIDPYSTGVFISSIPAGTPGAFIEILITDTTPTPLYLYGAETNPAIDTSKIGAEYPIETGVNCCFTGSEKLTGNVSVVDATLSTSYFSPSANIASVTSALPAGVNGHTKTILFDSRVGPLATTVSITVANPAWAGSTITLPTVGSGCTLQYINNKWFCIGNNGATFT